MADFLAGLFRADFLPHGWCYRWDSATIWLHVVSDLLIALAYYFIPVALIHIVRRRGDVVYPWMFWLFGTFILACGTTHLASVLMVWYPWYRLDGVIKLITALASVPTAVLLFRIAPDVIAIPGPAQLRTLNGQLAQEIAERKSAEEEVRRLNADLERRVEQRTAELKELNAKLQESEYRFRTILDSSPLLFFLKDTEGRYQFVNRQFEQTFGYTREDMQARTDYDLFPPAYAEPFVRADRKVLEQQHAQEFEEYAMVDGQRRAYSSVKFPLADNSGTIYAVCGIASDITERKRAEERLRQHNEDWQQFAYVAAHDLQEPLRNVRAYSQLLIRHCQDHAGAEGREFLAYILAGVDRMQALVAGLQSYSEISSNQIPELAVDAGRVLEQTLSSMSITIADASAIVTAGPLPKIRIDAGQLRQLFQNLIANAIRYRSLNPPLIHIRAEAREDFHEFIVRDNGIGIDMRFAAQIFGVFKRLHGPGIPGTGIGLAICRKIVELNGGRIWVESQPGEGSEFHFTVPC